MAYILASHSFLIGCECEGRERFSLEIVLCRGCPKDNTSTAECDVFEKEMCYVRLGYGVLSRAEDEEVCDYNHNVFGP